MQLGFLLKCWLTVLLFICCISVASSGTATYSSSLGINHPQYARSGTGPAVFYYETIRVTVTSSGSYNIRSSSTVDMYGYIYRNTFNPSSPSSNLLTQDDDSGGSFQFSLTVSLQPSITYILVVTTFSQSIRANFSITASGPGTITFNGLTITTTTLRTATINSTIPQSTTRRTATTSRVAATTREKSRSPTSEPMVTSQRTVTRIPGCLPPTITLIPNATLLSNPASYRKSQDFSISASITVHCLSSLAINIGWTINNCSLNCSLIRSNRSIITTSRELFIPARTLDYGIYQFKIMVTMASSSAMSSSASAYVTITQSGITANLVPLGTSIITSGYEKNLTLDPGAYSINPDTVNFNANEWNYVYYCRPYDLYHPTNAIQITMLDQPNHPCFVNRRGNGTAIKYNPNNELRSSVIILAGSLTPNETYQFVVYMSNRRNSSFQATGFVLVKVEYTKPQLIVIGCVISTMCSPNTEYQYINPTTQVALFSQCIGNCSSLIGIQWNIYQGLLNSLTQIVQWSRIDPMHLLNDRRFFGLSTSNLTVVNDLFLTNSNVSYWRFEVMYFFSSENSSSALNFIINQPPHSGSCSIDPLTGTTSTLFTIICSSWLDEDGIKDYSFYAWTTDRSRPMMLASGPSSEISLRLPAGDVETSLINIIVHIRDVLYCVTEYDVHSVFVQPDLAVTAALTNVIGQANIESINSNPVIQLLAGGDSNTVGQILTSISQIFNEMNEQNVDTAVQSGVPAASISISPLGSSPQSTNVTSINVSALNDFNEQLNKQANVLDYLISFSENLPINTAENIKLQASTLAKMTDSTNQLTRKTSMLASTKCHQLANTLHLMANRIPYEDIQIIATHLSQCATNVFTAVNGPLQERGSSLDLDLTRANAFPDDYDTDLEFPWSNSRLYSNGKELSWAELQLARNNYYQEEQARIIGQQTNETYSFITAALNIHLNLGQSMTINTPSIFFTLETATVQSLSNKFIPQVGQAQIQIPSLINISENSSVTLRSMMQPLASAGKSHSEGNTNLSTSISFSVLDEHGNDLPVQANIEQPIEIIIPRDPNLEIPSMNFQNVTNMNEHNQSYHFHYQNLTRTNNLSISFHLEIHPLDRNLAYSFLFNFDHQPQLNQSIEYLDGWKIFCPSDLTNEDLYTYFIDNQRVADHQSIIYGLRELTEIENEQFCSKNSQDQNISRIFNERVHFTSDYEIRMYTSGCYYLHADQQWKSDGLIVGPLTNYHQTQCYSTHLTTFAGGFLVLPSSINWNYVFSNADFIRNKTIYLTVIFIVVLYVILMIYSRYQDKKDTLKLGVTPLPDNQQVDRYFYQIIVFTGHRMDSGTKSKVHFVLGGIDDESGVRTFADPHREIFQRGGIDAFIMAVPNSLGPLTYLRLWHDNSGRGNSASWFVKYIIIRDLQTMDKSYFLCQRWFAVEKDDGMIERLLPVAGDEQTREFSHVLSKQAYHSLSEGHLWFSIFSRPPSNHFTRVQRCTCCFVLFFITMLLNILYYDQMNESKATTSHSSLSIGSYSITTQQIGIGVLVEFLSFVPSLFLVQLFRRSKQRPSKEDQLSLLQKTLMNLRAGKQSMKTKRKSSWKFPWWCLYLAYFLSFIFIGISIFFIIIRGIQFGDLKTQQWIISLIIGFFSSIFFTQPLKVMALAIFFAFFLRSSKSDEEIAGHVDDDHDQMELAEDEEYLHEIKRRSLFVNRTRNRINRLDKIEIQLARIDRQRDLHISAISRQLISYLSFLTILYLTTYSNRNANVFLQVNHLRHFFTDHEKIISMNDYWKWLEKDFVGKLRAQQWYNGYPPRNLSGYLDDKSNRLIGWATMRQLRSKDSCQISSFLIPLNFTCVNDYQFTNEEQRSFHPGWTNETIGTFHSSVINAFTYRSSQDLDSYVYMSDDRTYNSGGYVYEYRGRLTELRSNLSELHRLEWIDRNTRAVIIQLTLYNANVQLFTSVILLAEFLPTGGVVTTARFEPMNFQNFSSLSQILLGLIYMSFIIYFMFIEIRLIDRFKWKYFTEFWSYIQWGIIISSWTCFGITIWRYREMNRISDLFRQTNGYVYINLQLMAYVNDVLTNLFAFCCFFGTIKCLYYSRYNRRLAVFLNAIRYAWKDLVSFTVMFSVMFMGFVILFYLLFSSKIFACSTFLQTIQMLFETILMKFDATEISLAHRFIGPMVFTLFVFFIIFVGMTMFISIISDSFRTVRNDPNDRLNEDYLIFPLMCKRFLRWTKIKKANEWEKYEEHDAMMRSQYYDPIERFPEKIDQLLEMLDRIYQSQLPRVSKHD